jgi:hypothetical protein
LGHEFGVHAHLPCAVHSCLLPQAAQTPPAAPQFWAFGVVMQTPLAQHPVQVPPPHEHAPFVQACPLAQAPQALPPVPHAAVPCSVGATHLALSQQPVEHEAVVHSQTPAVLQA